MTSYAKPLPAPRGIPPSQSMDGSLVSTQQMESEETDGRPKPPIGPKPRVLPKPLTKVPTTDASMPVPSSMPWSPKSPVSEVPSAEKINLLTGPKPYGAGSSGFGTRRPSLTFKRQTSESLPVDEVCSSTVAPESKASAPLPPSASPSPGALPHDTSSLAMQTEVDSVRREPVHQEPTVANTNAKDARPPVMRKPMVSFHVKPVLGAPKPGRFPGTTVDQILAKMEEDKGTGLAPPSDRPWAQRSSLSFDGGYRFGSTAYSSFRRSPSTSESPQEDVEGRGNKEVEAPGPAGAPASPLFQGSTAWSTTKQSHAVEEAAPLQERAVPPEKSPKRRTDSASTVTDRLKEADSTTMVPETTDSSGAKTSSIWNNAPDNIPETKSLTVLQEPSRVDLVEELPSSLLLSEKPLIPSKSPLVNEKDTRAHIKQELPSTLSAVGEIHGPANAPVSSRTSLETELVSSLLLGGAPLVSSSLESPAIDRVLPRDTEAVEVATPLKGSLSLGRDSQLMEGSHRKDIGDTPAMPERSMGGMDWSLSESFEWSSPAKSSEWSAMTANAPSSSRLEELVDQRLSGSAGGVSDPPTDSSVIGGTAQELYSLHGLSMGGSQEHPEVKTGVVMDQTRLSVTTTTDLKFSNQDAVLPEHPDNIQDYETYEIEEVPRWERRHYSGDQAGSVTLGSSQGEESISVTTLEMLKKRDDHPVERASSGLVDVGLHTGTCEAHGSYAAGGSSEEPQEEAGGERSWSGMFQAEEVFEPHTVTTKVLQVQPEPGLARTAGLADAREVMEPLRPILLSDPAAEPCVLYHGLGPVEHAIPSREDDSCLAALEDRGESVVCRPTYEYEIGEHQSMAHAPYEAGMHMSRSNAGQTFEVGDFDPIIMKLDTKKAREAGGSNSQWLEELLSPTPAAKDGEQESNEAQKSTESENGMLGWSQKDLQSEFGTGVSEQIGHSESVWDDQYGFGGTNKSQELDLENSDWSKTHGIEESSWKKESEPPNTDWSVKHNMGDPSKSGESGISHMDWSVKHSTEGEEPGIGHRDWSIKHSEEKEEEEEEEEEEEDQSAEAGVIGRDYSIKHSIGYTAHGEEPEIGHRDWSISQSMEERILSKKPEISHKGIMGEKYESNEPGFSYGDWSMKHSVGDGVQSQDPEILRRDCSLKHSIGDADRLKEPEIAIGDLSITHSMGQKVIGDEPGLVGRDWSIPRSFVDSGNDREPEISSRYLSITPSEGETDGSRKQNIAGIGVTEEFGVQRVDRTIDQHFELDDQQRVLSEAYKITNTDQLSEGGFRGKESGMDIGEIEMGTDLGRMDRLREIVERRDELETERPVHDHGVERYMGGGEVESTYKSNVEAVEKMLGTSDGQSHREYLPYGGSPEPGDDQNKRDSKDLSFSSPRETLQPEVASSSLLDEMLGRGASRQSPPNERPASLQSRHSQESKEKPMDYTPPSLTEVDSPRKSVEAVSPIQSHADVEHERRRSYQDKAVDRSLLMEEEGEAPEEMDETLVPEVDFSFLEETEVLDCSVHRTRASLSRKRGHRVPTARPGAANTTECDGDDWMFQDSTEPKVARPDSSDEETASGAAEVAEEEEQPQKSSKKSPVSQGKKLGIFAGFNPMALKAKLKSRKSAEEGEQPKSPRQKDNFQRSKSCKLPAESGKPLVLPPKPEKTSGSESSTPQWLSALKIKKKPPK